MSSIEDDELGSFFAEIDNLEPSVSTSNEEQKKVVEETKEIDNEEEPPIQKRRLEIPVVTVKSVPVVSKPVVVSVAAALPTRSVDPFPTLVQYGESGTGSEIVRSSAFSTANPTGSTDGNSSADHKKKNFIRKAGGEVWKDESLEQWPENDFRLFVGDLSNEVTTEQLARHFQQYKSFAMAKVVRSKGDNKSKGYGFISFLDGMDCLRALREQQGKYIGSRPMKLKRSSWEDRNINEVKKKENKKKKMLAGLGLA